jgi:hypothetical protein
VNDYEDPDFASLDTYIRTQLAAAAETYVSKVDLRTKLAEMLKAGKDNEHTDRPETPTDA